VARHQDLLTGWPSVAMWLWLWRVGGNNMWRRGSNISTVALRVVGGDEKGTQCLGYNWATLFLGDINTGTWPSGWGSLESRTIKCGHEFRRTRTWEWLCWRGPAAVINDRLIISSKRMLYKDYESKCSAEKNASGESEGTCRQHELIGGEPPVVK
jgi:hypothetical protein